MKGQVIKAIVVCVQCGDGKLRTVNFNGRQAQMVFTYLRSLQGNKLSIDPAPMLLVNDTDELRDAVAKIEAAKESEGTLANPSRPTGFWPRMRALFLRTSNFELRASQPEVVQ